MNDNISTQSKTIIKRHKNRKLTITQEEALHGYLCRKISKIRPGDFKTLVAVANHFIDDQQYDVQPLSKKWVNAFVNKSDDLSKVYFRNNESKRLKKCVKDAEKALSDLNTELTNHGLQGVKLMSLM